MKISYESSDLIEELKMDIEEFGNIDMYAYFEKVKGFTFLTNYDFILEEEPLCDKDFDNEDTVIVIMKASDILKILEYQDSI